MNEVAVDLKISVGAATDVGGREQNEDAVLLQSLEPFGTGATAAEGGFLLAVADGMGGHQDGEVASKIAIETLQAAFAEDPGADVVPLMKQAFRRANSQIYQNGAAGGESRMMGTTLVACAIRGKYATIASIGDSRAYLARADHLTQITLDHTFVAQQVAQGEMTAEQAKTSPRRNQLIHALGHRDRLHSSIPSVFELTLLPEDRLLLCSDGFYDVVADEDVVGVLLRAEPAVAARQLVELANERNTTDNVTAIVLEAESTRIIVAPAPVAADAGGRSFLVPTLLAVIALVIIAIVLALTVL